MGGLRQKKTSAQNEQRDLLILSNNIVFQN